MPDSLRDVLLEFSIAYLSEQPKDVVDYAVEFFTKLQEKRNHSNNMVSVEINSPDEESILSQEDGEWGERVALVIWADDCEGREYRVMAIIVGDGISSFHVLLNIKATNDGGWRFG